MRSYCTAQHYKGDPHALCSWNEPCHLKQPVCAIARANRIAWLQDEPLEGDVPTGASVQECCCDWVNTMGVRNEHINATQITASTTIGVLKKRVLRMNPVPSLTTYLKMSSRKNGSSRPLITQRTFYFALRLPSISASIIEYNLNVEILFSKVNDHDHAQRCAQSRLTPWAGLENTLTFEEHCECMSGFSTLMA